MNLFFMIGIVALSLTNCNVESQENLTTLGDVSNEEISVGSEQTDLDRVKKMTNEQKSNALTEIMHSANLFSLKFYKNFAGLGPRVGNFVLPVFAIFQSMGLIASYSTGDTKQQIHEVLELPKNRTLIFAGFSEINRTFVENGIIGSMSPTHLFISDQHQSLFTSVFRRISYIYYTRLFAAHGQPPGTMEIVCATNFHCCIRSQEIWREGYRDLVRVIGKYRQLPEIEATLLEIPCQKCWNPDVSDKPNLKSTRMFIILPNRVNDFYDWEQNIERLNISKLSIGDLHDAHITVPLRYDQSIYNMFETLTRMGLTKIFSKNPEIFPTMPQIKFKNMQHFGLLEIAKQRDSITDPGLTYKNIPEVTVDRPFITIVTTADENPLILHMSRHSLF